MWSKVKLEFNKYPLITNSKRILQYG